MDSSRPHLVNLQEEKQTLLITLQARALDNQSKHPILGDSKAEEILNLINYDFDKLRNFGNEIMVIRAKQFDAWVRHYIDTYQNVTRLTCISVFGSQYIRHLPLKTRVTYGLLALIPNFRHMMRLLLYEF